MREMGRSFTYIALMALSKRGRDVMFGTLLSLAFMMAYRFSMRLRPGEFPGQSMTLICFSFSRAITFLLVWQRAPS
jgi:hypothetical protein